MSNAPVKGALFYICGGIHGRNKRNPAGLTKQGPLAEPARELLEQAGYASITPTRASTSQHPQPARRDVLFQRPGDVVVSVRDGSVDFGITGWDVVLEKRARMAILIIHRPWDLVNVP